MCIRVLVSMTYCSTTVLSGGGVSEGNVKGWRAAGTPEEAGLEADELNLTRVSQSILPSIQKRRLNSM